MRQCPGPPICISSGESKSQNIDLPQHGLPVGVLIEHCSPRLLQGPSNSDKL